MINTKYKRLYFILLSTVIIAFDQLSKFLVSINFQSIVNKNLIIFTIDNLKNYGAAFNFFNGSRIFLSIISLLVSLFLLFCITKNNNLNLLNLYSYSFILAGTIGNGLDRILKGYVIDFINLNFISFPVFNIADISINIGFFLIIYSLVQKKN